MRWNIIFFALLWAGTVSGSSLKNGNFDEFLQGRSIPAGWIASDAGVVRAERGGGNAFLRIRFSRSTPLPAKHQWHRGAFLFQNVPVKPDTLYSVSCRIRGELSGGKAGIALQFQGKNLPKEDRRIVKYLPLDCSEKEFRNLSCIFKTPPECTGLRIYAAAEDLNGYADFDDFVLAESPPVPRIPLHPEQPDWSRASVFEHFLPKVSDTMAPTRIFLAATKRALHVRGECFEPEMGNRRLKAVGRDDKVWADDHFEFLIDPQRSGSSCYQICINADGAVFDARNGDTGWNPPLNLKTEKYTDRWCFEFEIPFTELGYGKMEAEIPDKPMALALFRNRRNKALIKPGVYPYETASWQVWNRGNHRNPERFAWVSVGSGTQGEAFDFRFRAQLQNAVPPQAWQIKEPLFIELMGKEALVPAGEDGGICYIGRMLNMNRGNNITAFCLQHGMEYSVEKMLSLCEKMRIPFSPVGYSALKPVDRKRRKHYQIVSQHDGGRYYEFPSDPHAPGLPGRSKRYFYPDERVAASVEKHVLDTLRHKKDKIEFYVLGHESRALYFIRYDEFRALYRKEEPEVWQRWSDEAKKLYGGGKYGFPESKKNSSPMERMVYQRWVTDRYNRYTDQLIGKMRVIAPGVKLVSEVDVNGVNPFGYERMHNRFDFVTQQMYWGHGSARQSAGFNVKVLVDLYGTKVLGGPHAEHYYVSLTGEEYNEVLSSVFRAGGSGLFLWLIDWSGITHSDYYGAPERMTETISIFETYSRMRKIRFPEPDCGILFNNLSQFARNWFGLNGAGGGHEQLFTLLGPHLGCAFRFVSDYQIADGKGNLDSLRILYVPCSKYTDERTMTALKEFMDRGGIVISFDPENFSLDDKGVPRSITELTGAEITGKKDFTGEAKTQNSLSFRFPGRDSVLWKLLPGTEVLAAAAGRPLVIRRTHGKGALVTFAGPVLTDELYADSSWRELLKTFQQKKQCRMNEPVWRFRFPYAPHSRGEGFFPDDRICLTGNAWRWQRENLLAGNNAKEKFRCRYLNAPDLIPDAGTPGKLFDRPKSLLAKPVLRLKAKDALAQAVAPWCVAWKNQEEATVILEFDKELTADRFAVYCHGGIPEISAGIMDAQGKFKKLGSVDPRKRNNPYPALDVVKTEIRFSPVKSKCFALHFGRRTSDFYLAEIELWTPKN